MSLRIIYAKCEVREKDFRYGDCDSAPRVMDFVSRIGFIHSFFPTIVIFDPIVHLEFLKGCCFFQKIATVLESKRQPKLLEGHSGLVSKND